MVHGDWERAEMEKVQKNGGLCYGQYQHETNLRLAEELGVKRMVSKEIQKCTSICTKIKNCD